MRLLSPVRRPFAPRLEGREPIGLLAGSGRFPILFAETARGQGLPVACVGIRYEASAALRDLCESYQEVGVSKLGGMIRAFKRTMNERVAATAARLEARVPRLRAGDGRRILVRAAALVIGLKQVTEPTPAVAALPLAISPAQGCASRRGFARSSRRRPWQRLRATGRRLWSG